MRKTRETVARNAEDGCGGFRWFVTASERVLSVSVLFGFLVSVGNGSIDEWNFDPFKPREGCHVSRGLDFLATSSCGL